MIEVFWFSGEGWVRRVDGGPIEGPFATYREASTRDAA